MSIFLVEGEPGVKLAVERAAIAVVVDALRTSATIPALFDSGAREVIAVARLEDAQRLKADMPGALLAGAIGQARIPGFDMGNSPTEVREGPRFPGKTVIFASTAGSRRLVEAIGAFRIFVGSPVNAAAAGRLISRLAREEKRDVVVVACGHVEAGISAPEDVHAAAYLASILEPEMAEESREAYDRAIEAVVTQGLPALFKVSASAKKLEKLGFARDVVAAARPNLFRSVPVSDGVVEVPGGGTALRLVAASREDDWRF
jgi:2-phosphosulfolactate phosphatase